MAKTPNQSDENNYIGIELEFYCSYSRSARDIFRSHAISKYAELGNDSSIRPPNDGNGYNAHELRILCKYVDMPMVMKTAQDFLNTVKAKANESCGVHVHLDMRKADAIKAYSNLIKWQDTLFKLIPKERRQSQYCVKVSKESSEKIQHALKYMGYSKEEITKAVKEYFKKMNISNVDSLVSDRFIETIYRNQESVLNSGSHHYHGISANPIIEGKYKTIEVRLHQGTTNCNEIRRWCRLLYEIAYNDSIGKFSETFIKERIAKYG